MKFKRMQRHQPASGRFGEHVRKEQFTYLRRVLDRSKTGRDSELTLALEKMLDAGQIECEPFGQRSTEILMAARVIPAEIRELLPLAHHPVTQALLRCFVERHIAIPRLMGVEHKLPFQKMPGAEFGVFASGVEDPPELGDACRQWAAEKEVVQYLGVPYVQDAGGWADLSLARRSIQIRCVGQGDEQFSYPTIEDFKKDLVIVALPTTPDEPVGLIGWIDRAQFVRLHRTVNRGDERCCVLKLADLLPMAVLKGGSGASA